MFGLFTLPVHEQLLLLLMWTLAPVAIAQTSSDPDSPSSTNGPSIAMSTTAATISKSGVSAVSGPSSSTPLPPTCSDTGEGCQQQSNDNSRGVSSYYFVFLAIIVCVAGLATILVWRKKRRARYWGHSGREDALANDLSAWDPARQRRRYRQGRWRSAEVSREEGLNEHGEAPPPYVPKSREEEQAMREQNDAAGPAVPMQTLSREDVGLKPPDYTERHIRSASGNTAARSESSPREHADQSETHE